MPKWEHLVAGAAIHLLGPGQICSCKASHHSSHGPDERLEAVNVKLLEALEGWLAEKESHPSPEDGAAIAVCPGCWKVERRAREAIEEARK